jgi:hypothetical protein
VGGGGKEPADWGKDVGKKLKDACKDRKPDLVLVFDFGCNFKDPMVNKGVVDGVAEHFDKKTIYGSSIHGYEITNSSSVAMAGALALGGIKATPVKVALEKGKEEAAYTTLAESLKSPYTEAAGKGRLIFIFGECVPRTNNEKIVDAFTKTLGKDVCLFGSPTPGAPHAQYFQGELLTGNLTAILITGDFTCGFAMADASPAKKGDQRQDNDKIVESAEKALKTAMGDKKDNAVLVFLTNCYTRCHSAKGDCATREYKAITKDVTAPLLGIMSDLDIGHPATGEPAAAKEDQINVCVIFRQKK